MKIKKYAAYVLILIALFGTFTKAVKAANGENCSDHQLATQSQCEAAGFTWTPDSVLNTNGSTGTNTNTVCSTVAGLGGIICKLNQIINSLIPLLLALGVVYFVWGVVQYVIGDEQEAKTKGRDRMIYGIIGLTAITSLWGLVNIVVTTFGIGGQSYANSLAPQPGIACQFVSNGATVPILLNYVTCVINNSVIPLVFALAVVMFVWGVVQFVINSDEEAKKERGRQFMLWGIIALTVMVSVWGLVKIFGTTFGIDSTFIPKVKP